MKQLLEIVLSHGNAFYQRNYTIEDLTAKGRKSETSSIRFAFIYLSKLYTNYTSKRISEMVNREETTVLHCFRNVDIAASNPAMGNFNAYKIATMAMGEFINVSGKSEANLIPPKSNNRLTVNQESRDQRVRLAKALYISQQSISELISELEKDTDLQGFIKHRISEKLNKCREKLANI